MSARDYQLIVCKDGSHTLYVPELNEHYHSVYGAIQESRHVFIREGFEKIEKKNICVLEIGFGTGLNTLLTCFRTIEKKQKVNYTTLEPFPLDKSIWEQLNYPEILKKEDAQRLFFRIHEAVWEKEIVISESIKLLKIKKTLEEIVLKEGMYDLVYFDAFAPDVHPSLWSEENFLKIYQAMKVGGILVTYSSKGSVKRAMRAVGFQVKRLTGAGGKRHMVRALKAGAVGNMQ